MLSDSARHMHERCIMQMFMLKANQDASSMNLARKAIFFTVCTLLASMMLSRIVSLAQSGDPTTQRQLGDSTMSRKAGDSIPDYAIKLAGGRFDKKSTWGVWLFGDHVFGNCWSTQTTTRGASFGDTYCDYPVPPAYWRLISSGPVGRNGDPRAMLFFLTRRDVGRITALVNQGNGRRDRWIDLKTRVISLEQVHKSHAHSNFSYAVAIFSGSLFCVKQVIVFDRSGNQVRNVEPHCSGPRDPIKENFE